MDAPFKFVKNCLPSVLVSELKIYKMRSRVIAVIGLQGVTRRPGRAREQQLSVMSSCWPRASSRERHRCRVSGRVYWENKYAGIHIV